MFRGSLGQAARGLAFFILVAAAHAGSFAVSPVRATLSAKQPVASFLVRNDGAEPVVVQLEPLAWTQDQGKDIYTATKDILATPPIFTVPAGGSQVVRVGIRRAAEPNRELTYRLFLQEVPPARIETQGLRVVLRVGVPVFVIPPIAASPVLRWQALRTTDDTLKLRLTNEGNAHIQIARSKLTSAGVLQPLGVQDVPAYVLPKQSREWLYKVGSLPAAGSPLRVAAQTDAGDVQAELVLE